MTNNCSANWRKRLLFTASVLAISATASEAQQAQFTRNVGFGDSYVDTGKLFTVLGSPNPPAYPTGRFSGGTNFFDTTSSLLGISQVNYALGGARAGTLGFNGIPNLGFTTEVAGFIGSGKTFTSTDLLTVSIGGNDARAYYQNGGTLAGIAADVATTSGQAAAGIQALVGAGARTVVFTAGDVGTLPEAQFYGQQAQVGTAYSAAFNAQMQTKLAAIAASGVRVEYVDIALVGNAIRANPAATGITNFGACPNTCVGNPALQKQYLFYVDGIHLTSAGFDVLGQYVVNRLNAPLGFAAQGQNALSTTTGFASTMFGRADLFATQAAIAGASGPNGMMSLGAKQSAHSDGPAKYSSGMQAYILGKGSSTSTQASGVNPGYNTLSEGGTVGLEYKYGRSSMIGAAFDFTNATARLGGGAGKTTVDAFQLGGYASYNPSNFFAQGLVSYGTQTYKNTRAGVLLGDITSAPSGTSGAAAGKIGYLYNVGGIKVGPIAGLTFASATTRGYTENGDAALTLNVGKQTVEALVASAGIQLRFPMNLGGHNLMPYVNITAEEDLKGSGRAIQYSATSAPVIVNTWNIDSGSKHVYGRIAAGAQSDINATTALNLNVNTTFGRGGTNGVAATGGVAFKY
jgi:outer membrane lipase/esterase